jgi:hypothetical protein
MNKKERTTNTKEHMARWTEKSLAAEVSWDATVLSRLRQADAVERITQAGRRVWDLKAKLLDTLEARQEWYAALDALGAEVEAAENWTK